ncbi:hypothetical protein KC19_12G164900 [Ceratodon purpureus]|uniref:Uncharacterized protein n=1 Tax=Ceratodon purpureus TaxID=3225 RepID=A0A8T0G8J7_CERPU|nr:hypothetical protein KC19_12G164900 [Ceratodon purpureus]
MVRVTMGGRAGGRGEQTCIHKNLVLVVVVVCTSLVTPTTEALAIAPSHHGVMDHAAHAHCTLHTAHPLYPWPNAQIPPRHPNPTLVYHMRTFSAGQGRGGGGRVAQVG